MRSPYRKRDEIHRLIGLSLSARIELGAIVQNGKIASAMSEMGQKQASHHSNATALLPKADIRQRDFDVRFGSKADIGTRPINVRYYFKSGH